MKQDCLICERSSPDNNLYCQEIYCPAEMSPTILDFGEWLGNIEIVKPLIILRSCTLYQARYQKQKVLLKVAHPGPENRERLKREAQFLQQLQRAKDSKAHTEYFPVLLSPYGTTKDNDPYGKVVLKGHLLYYSLFEHHDGEPLRDILTKNLQLWIYHIGWVMRGLASAVAFLQSKGLFHYSLSPDAVLVHFDDESGAPHVLLFDLGVISDRQTLRANWYSFLAPPAYTAPELIDTPAPQPHYATDVYGLGLTLYEMLVGQPAFPFKLHGDDEVYDAVRQGRRVPMNRSEDVKSAADIALKATERNITARYQTAAEMVQDLHKAFGMPPRPKTRLPLILTLLVVGALVATALLIYMGGGRA